MFFREKFGLFHVDFNDPDRTRTAKKSAEFFSQIIKSNKIPVEWLKVVGSKWRNDTVGSSEFNTFICLQIYQSPKLIVILTST